MKPQRRFDTVPVDELKAAGLDYQLLPDTNAPSCVLVVDDERLIVETLVIILRQAGLDAYGACSGHEALEVAAEIHPDVLISDIVMPLMDGTQLACAIRRSWPKCKVILFSGQANMIDTLAIADSRPDNMALLAKPIHPHALLLQLAELGINCQIAPVSNE